MGENLESSWQVEESYEVLVANLSDLNNFHKQYLNNPTNENKLAINRLLNSTITQFLCEFQVALNGKPIPNNMRDDIETILSIFNYHNSQQSFQIN